MGERRIGGLGDHVEAGEEGDRRHDHPRHHHLLAADPVRQPAEEQVERDRDDHEGDHDLVHRRRRDLDHVLHEELRVEEARVPDRPLGDHHGEEGDQDDLQVRPLQEGLDVGLLRAGPLLAHLLEQRTFGQLQPDPDRDGQERGREQEGDAPAPGGEVGLADDAAHDQHHDQGAAQAEGGRAAQPGAEVAALARRGVLGDVDRRPAPLAPQRQPLGEAQAQENDRSDDPHLGVGRHQADGEGRHPHQAHGDQEGALAAQTVTDAAEDQRAEGPEGEAGGEGAEGEDVARRLVQTGEEGLGDDPGQGHEQEEVVPLERRARGRGRHHKAHIGRFALGAVRRRSRHLVPPDIPGIALRGGGNPAQASSATLAGNGVPTSWRRWRCW